MPTVASIMAELKKKGKESTRKIYARHGMATEGHYPRKPNQQLGKSELFPWT